MDLQSIILLDIALTLMCFLLVQVYYGVFVLPDKLFFSVFKIRRSEKPIKYWFGIFLHIAMVTMAFVIAI